MKLIPLLLLAIPLFGGVIYDGSLNTLPQAQGWIYNDPSALADQSGSVTLSTLDADAIQAGYALFPSPVLVNLAQGVRFRFDVRLDQEFHSDPNRAGFSIIVMGILGPVVQGIELSLWQNTGVGGANDEVWAQNTNFTKGESAAIDADSGVRTYELLMQGNSYQLFVDGAATLGGSLRSYPGAPYIFPHFVFVGDDTTSARGQFTFTYAEANSIPEPGTAVLAGGVILLAIVSKLGRI